MSTFNSREYEWADITVVLGGRPLLGITGISYSEEIEREAIYAKGRTPYSIQSGNIKYEGELTLLQSEVDALERSGGGSILSLSLNAEVVYGDPLQGNAITTKRIEGIRFKKSPRKMKTGDKFQEIALPFVALNVKTII
ncbi:hypothetical protein [Aquimarina algiphila]|uniref:hypothetical protein n=1 Tax=Aquimarina algiphila TaxID=2047982 RepID=UPI00232AA9A5|nr:hypothetical protein [Aquimarina algiphila]